MKNGKEKLPKFVSREWMLFYEAPEPLWLVRLSDLVLLDANRSASERFGFTREQYANMTLADFHREGDIERLRRAAKTGDASSSDLRGWKTHDVRGETIDTDLSVRFVEIAGEKCVLICALDMTARKALEGRLRQAGKMEAIGMLAGGIAHDFNNLLTIISGYSQLLMNVVPDGERTSLEQVLRASERAAELTGQLLAFSRRQELQPQALSVNKIVSGMSTMLRRLIGEHIELKLSLASDLGVIHADPSHVDQIIMNLAVNARDAMAEGGVLRIETANVEVPPAPERHPVGLRAGLFVMLVVSDTGVGMDAKTRARVFDPFFTTKEKGRGTGLGLSTVYGIVKQAGGTVELDSVLDQGTSVKVYFPRIEAASDDGTGKSRFQVSPEERGGREAILVVEDEDAVRRLVRATLERRGYRVLVASDGREALSIARSAECLDLVIADLVMPQMSGVEVAEQICAFRSDIKVLFMSGYTDRSLQKTEELPEGAEFLQKPFTPEMLAKCVRDVLDRGRGENCQVMGSNL